MRKHRGKVSTPRSPALAGLIIGLFITLTIAMANYFWPQATAVKDALMISLVGVSVSVALSVRLKLSEISQSIADIERDAQGLAQIQQWAKKDSSVLNRYTELRKEIEELVVGTYRLKSIDEVFEDDVRSIDELRAGEVLRSTCPISTVSAKRAREQIADLRYLASIQAHIAAAQRGVDVTRIYLFRDIAAFGDDVIVAHLKDLAGKLRIEIILHSEARLREEFDYLVFGDRRVSVGVVGGNTGTVQAATVHSDRDTVERYIEKYGRLRTLAGSLEVTITKLQKFRARN
ncbi:hypothetical protein [Amycolatopsis sp. BJA-103]|uniref:hypothetical protein n=1 Tax=Amycolatopsis sp. BJA-103 TaxID=1911175 RepID=UPI000C7909EF|nr:hypothetical protein [Amycolatopsis sp. BJA-103]AUI61184.1 hypothetical protein BKN51_25380 [Amycolatopsis sp. BJA-103]PNE21527.1 hypothetical protein B1H26_07090 [Amycolatopsis sp. BJA-103]